MIRLRSFAASARQVRLRSFAASARQVRVIATVLVLLAGSSSTAFACPMCFGAEETTMIDATRLGILVMLGIVLAVQGAFVAFFLHLRKAAKRNAELELEAEWSELQRSRT